MNTSQGQQKSMQRCPIAASIRLASCHMQLSHPHAYPNFYEIFSQAEQTAEPSLRPLLWVPNGWWSYFWCWFIDIAKMTCTIQCQKILEDPALLMQRYSNADPWSFASFAPRKIEHVHALRSLSTPENYKSNSRGLKFGEQNTSDLEISVSIFKNLWFSLASTYK